MLITYFDMKNINWTFISASRKCKCFVVSAIIVLFVLIYLYVYEFIDVISKDEIFDNLVSVDGSLYKHFCPLGCVDESHGVIVSSRLQRVNLPAEEWKVLRGGEWKPKRCDARYVVAIIVPYRARENHLEEFVSRIHPFVQKQNVHYRLYVIEQGDQKQFNRGKLLNVGFVEALKDKLFPCFIFHDVDLIPENKCNIYACTRTPRHMSAAIDKYYYRLPYYRNFGGVLAILADHFKLVNGYSNNFFGWGGEDDDFYDRIRRSGLRPMRFDARVSRYYSLDHEPAMPNELRFDTIKNSSFSYDKDGINSLNYSVIERSNENLFTKIIVEL